MRVCMVSHHGCIRVYKEAEALLGLGIKVDVLTNHLPYAFGHFTSAAVWFDREQLVRSVKNSSADIFHVHNTPDWMVGAVREGTSRPIVYDCHDLETLIRQGITYNEEREAFSYSDAVVHSSEGFKKVAEKIHGKKRSIILYPYVNRRFICTVLKEPGWWSLVYEGGLSGTDKALTGDNKVVPDIRYLAPVFKFFLKYGLSVTTLGVSSNPSSSVNYDIYRDMGCVVLDSLPYPVMLKELAKHGFGLVGAYQSFPLMELAMPNKLFEYISQGVVPVVINAIKAEKFVTENKCGIVLEPNESINLDDLQKWGRAIRRNILAIRQSLCMENHIQPLVDLYKSL